MKALLILILMTSLAHADNSFVVLRPGSLVDFHGLWEPPPGWRFQATSAASNTNTDQIFASALEERHMQWSVYLDDTYIIDEGWCTIQYLDTYTMVFACDGAI